MKVILFSLCLLPFSCWAIDTNQSNLSKQEFINKFAQQCGFRLGDKLTSIINSYRISENGLAYHVGFQTNVKNRTIKFSAYDDCIPYDHPTLPKNEKVDPKSIINQQDMGGRYSSHVKWQKNYTGLNWKGKIAYIDSFFGDGQTGYKNDFYLCSLNSFDCILFSVREPEKITSKEVAALLVLFEDISLINQKSKTQAHNP